MNSLPSQSIVLLDDERSYTDLMTQILADELNCPVHGFTRPLEALQAVPAINPSVIVTDYFMPQLTGIEFVQQAAPLVPAAAFVLITGNDLSAQETEIARLAALKGRLTKPFGWRKLAAEILRVWPATVPVPIPRGDLPAL